MLSDNPKPYEDEPTQGQESKIDLVKVEKTDQTESSPTSVPISVKQDICSNMAGGILSVGVGRLAGKVASDCGVNDCVATAIGLGAYGVASTVQSSLPQDSKSTIVQGVIGVAAVTASTEGTVGDKAKAAGKVIVTEGARAVVQSATEGMDPFVGFLAELAVDWVISPLFDWMTKRRTSGKK